MATLLRLAHRILSQKIGDLPDAYMPGLEDKVANLWNRTQKHLIEGKPVIVADNVAAYVNELYRDPRTAPKSYKQYPPCPPAFNDFFIEWNCPPGARYPGSMTFRELGFIQVGALVEVRDATNLSTGLHSMLESALGEKAESIFQAAKWHIVAAGYMCLLDGRAAPSDRVELLLDNEGRYLQAFGQNLFRMAHQEQPISGLEAVLMMTLGLMQCKNVSRIDVTKEEGPAPGWCKRKRLPTIRYSALLIDPNLGSKSQAGERKTEGDRSGKALHICRGHFMHSVNDGVSRGLFGRGIYGTFWVPAHVRGSADLGKVIPTYNVLAPTLQGESR